MRDAVRCHHEICYCSRCDLLVGLGRLHVTCVEFDGLGLLTVRVESPPEPMGCTRCGVVAHSHGRREVILVDAPCFDRSVRLVWRKRTWRCVEPECPMGVFTEQDEGIASLRALLTTRACWWALNQIRREHASVAGLAASLARPGTRSGSRSGRCCRRWLTTRPGSPASSGWVWMSTCGITCPRSRSRTAVVVRSS